MHPLRPILAEVVQNVVDRIIFHDVADLLFLCNMAAKEAEILGKYLPEKSIDYCFGLWNSHSIQLKITKPRKSIFGNYFFRNGAHHITVNGNLSKEAFLVTFLHEVGHLLVRKNQTRKVKPHGREWQKAFAEVMRPMLIPEVFPIPILAALKNHMESPAASSCSDPGLFSLLSGETISEGNKKVSEFKPGEVFQFQGREFLWLKSLRSRCECRCLQSGRLYRISAIALAEPVASRGIPAAAELGIKLSKLPQGQHFQLENRGFKILLFKRSRVLCEEVSTGRHFLIQGEREIPPEDLN